MMGNMLLSKALIRATPSYEPCNTKHHGEMPNATISYE